MYYNQVDQEIIKFCFSAHEYEECVINISSIKEEVIVNFRIDVGVCKFSIDGGLWRSCKSALTTIFCL